MATMCPTFKSAVYKTIQKHEDRRHYMEGGDGVCCFIWVTGPGITPKGNKSKRLVKACFSSNSLTLRGGAFDMDLKAIEGYRSHYVNID